VGSQALRRSAEFDYVESYWRDGYAVVRGFFKPAEVDAIGAAVDQVHDEGLAHGRCLCADGSCDRSAHA
jgi:hypothetical protein